MSRDCYQCGHLIKPIFIKKSIVEYALYNQWKDSKSKLCFDCWNKKRKDEFLKHCGRVLDNAKKIECPYCHYDGSDSEIGFSMPYVEAGRSVPKMRCKKCKRVFNVIRESKTGEKII